MLCLTLLCLFGLTFSQVSGDLGTEAIVGGDYAEKGSFKYQVSIHSGTYRCGGAIIADQYILTAGHCVTDADGHIRKEPCKVIAGTHDLKHTHNAIVTHAATVYIHKHLILHGANLHDIAVLKLKHPLNLGSHSHNIDRIKLPNPYADFDNVHAVVAGFGYYVVILHNIHGKLEEAGGKLEDKLKFAFAKVIPNAQCSQILKDKVVTKSFICAKVEQRNTHPHYYEGVCNGDSGSPLVFEGAVIGVLNSSPFACNETTEPARYQRVSSHLDMIHSILNGKPNEDVRFEDIPL